MKIKLLQVVGARPNFMKVAPIFRSIEEYNSKNGNIAIEQHLIHTGQHYSSEMSQIFLDDLGLPRPHVNLNVGSGTHAFQTAQTMLSFEKVLKELQPDLVVVVGDVNSTAACAITAKKMGIKVAHVEAGLRSFDRSMPEEINRIITDSISDLLFTTEPSANDNLEREGVAQERIYFVGNTMIDSVIFQLDKANQVDTLGRIGISSDGSGAAAYGLLTMHRPSNVDDPKVLSKLLEAVATIANRIPIIFPAHPRTANRIKQLSLGNLFISVDKVVRFRSGIALTEPVGYLDWLNLMRSAQFVITDSGGLQEETTFLKVPCLTIRENTERPVTLEKGTNTLVGQDPACLVTEISRIMSGKKKASSIPALWDGKTSKRILNIILKSFNSVSN